MKKPSLPGCFYDPKTRCHLDKRLRTPMAPLMERAITTLEASHVPLDAATIAGRCHGTVNQTNKHLSSLRRAGIVRIAGWGNKAIGQTGDYHRLYAMANGEKDAKKPKTMGKADRLRLWRKNMRKLLEGNHQSVIASRRMGGAESIVLSGKVIYQRDKGINYQALRQIGMIR